MRLIAITALIFGCLVVLMLVAVVISAGRWSRAEERAEEERLQALRREVEERRELARKMAVEECVWDPDRNRHSGLLEEDDP